MKHSRSDLSEQMVVTKGIEEVQQNYDSFFQSDLNVVACPYILYTHASFDLCY